MLWEALFGMRTFVPDLLTVNSDDEVALTAGFLDDGGILVCSFDCGGQTGRRG